MSVKFGFRLTRQTVGTGQVSVFKGTSSPQGIPITVTMRLKQRGEEGSHKQLCVRDLVQGAFRQLGLDSSRCNTSIVSENAEEMELTCLQDDEMTLHPDHRYYLTVQDSGAADRNSYLPLPAPPSKPTIVGGGIAPTQQANPLQHQQGVSSSSRGVRVVVCTAEMEADLLHQSQTSPAIRGQEAAPDLGSVELAASDSPNTGTYVVQVELKVVAPESTTMTKNKELKQLIKSVLRVGECSVVVERKIAHAATVLEEITDRSDDQWIPSSVTGIFVTMK